MNLLLDSHTVLWAVYEPERLPPEVRRLISDTGNGLTISLATVWELVNKAAAHRLPMVGSVARMVERMEEWTLRFFLSRDRTYLPQPTYRRIMPIRLIEC